MTDDKQQLNQNQKSQSAEQISQTGKSYEDVLPYLLSGESDDFPADFIAEK